MVFGEQLPAGSFLGQNKMNYGQRRTLRVQRRAIMMEMAMATTLHRNPNRKLAFVVVVCQALCRNYER